LAISRKTIDCLSESDVGRSRLTLAARRVSATFTNGKDSMPHKSLAAPRSEISFKPVNLVFDPRSIAAGVPIGGDCLQFSETRNWPMLVQTNISGVNYRSEK
jgi:hypothetical protein